MSGSDAAREGMEGGVQELFGWAQAPDVEEAPATPATADRQGGEGVTLTALLEAAIGDGTRAAVARRLGVTSYTVKTWMQGRAAPGPTARARLAALLGITPDEVQAAAERIEPPWRKLGERLKAARRRRGLSQQEAADVLYDTARRQGAWLFTHPHDIGAWERGVTLPPRQGIEALREEYGGDIADAVAEAWEKT